MAGAYFDNIVLEGVPREFIDEVHAAVREITLQRGFGQQVRLNGRPVAEPEPDSPTSEDEGDTQVGSAGASKPSSACTTPGGVPSASEADDEASDSGTRRRRGGRGGRRRRDASSSSSSSGSSDRQSSSSRGGSRSGSRESGRSGGRRSRSDSADDRGKSGSVGAVSTFQTGCRPK